MAEHIYNLTTNEAEEEDHDTFEDFLVYIAILSPTSTSNTCFPTHKNHYY